MMDNLVQKLNWDVQNLNWDMSFIKNQCMFVYAEADLVSNRKMQESLQKLYQYENQPDMRERIREYISELDTEIKRLEDELITKEPYVTQNYMCRIGTLQEVINDLKGRLEERI